MCYAGYKAVTCIKLICKLLIYARGVLKFLAQSPNYAVVLDEIVYFFQLGNKAQLKKMHNVIEDSSIIW